MRPEEEKNFEKRAAAILLRAGIAVLALAAFFLFFRYLLVPFLPFFISRTLS